MTIRCTCIACQINTPTTCVDTERAIRAEERRRLAAIVTAGLDRGDLNHLRTNLTGKDIRTAQLLVHALITVLDVALDQPEQGAA